MPRVFIAIPLSRELRETLGALPKDDGRRWRWVKEEQFHITLKFLGEISEDRLPAVVDAVAEAVVDGRATGGNGASAQFASKSGSGGASIAEADSAFIALSARGVGGFPRLNRARVLWVGLGGETDKLHRLQGAIEKQLARRGFPRDRRPFSPHITLARARNPRGSGPGKPGAEGPPPVPDSILACRDRPFGSWTVDAVQIVESVLGSGGPTYIVRDEVRLAHDSHRAR